MTALISECGSYRYSLERLTYQRQPFGMDHSEPLRTVLWIMLNPSTADAREDDPTIRRCMGFSERWGFDRMLVGNLFAYRCTDPAGLNFAQQEGFDIVGPRTNEVLMQLAEQAEMVVLGWGANGVRWAHRGAWVAKNITPIAPAMFMLARTANKQPGHPLRLPYESELQPWAS